jgi:hypothetical protein
MPPKTVSSAASSEDDEPARRRDKYAGPALAPVTASTGLSYTRVVLLVLRGVDVDGRFNVWSLHNVPLQLQFLYIKCTLLVGWEDLIFGQNKVLSTPQVPPTVVTAILRTVRSLLNEGSFLLTHCHQIYIRKEISRPGFLDVSR